MNKRVLVAYGSKAGSTAEIAAKIGETIAKKGFSVDVLPVKNAGDPSAYEAVVLGSAIRVGKVLPEVTAYMEKHRAALEAVPFHLFISCMTLSDDTPENRQTVSAYLDPVRALVKPDSEALFAGAMIPGRLPLLERLMIKAMKAPEGDFRQWEQISAWAESV